jgi:hypothetical protein
LLRAHSDSILGRRCDFVWEFTGNDGTLVNHALYHLQNFSFSAQRTILRDCDGFAVQHAFAPSYHAIERDVGTDANLRIVGGCELSTYTDYGGGPDIHQGEWVVTLDPPLNPLESIRILRCSVDQAVESRAFREGGTEFIVRPRHQFSRITMTVVAPDGYRFSGIGTAVDNQAGKPIRPTLAKGRLKEFGVRMLHWEIDYPGTDNRHKLRFRLVPL